MADETLIKKRITTYTKTVSKSNLTNSDVMFVDNPTEGTRKLYPKAVINNTITSSGVHVHADSPAITDVNDQPVNTVYTYDYNLQSIVANLPSNKGQVILHYSHKYSENTSAGQVMIAIERGNDEELSMYFRSTSGTPVSWGSWMKVANSADVEAIREELDNASNDISELKTIISRLLVTINYNHTLNVGGINPSTGGGTTSTSSCRTDSVSIDQNSIITVDNSEYIFQVWVYSSSSATSSDAIENPTNGMRVPSGTLVSVTFNGDIKYYRLEIRRADGKVLTTDLTDPASDYSIISKAIKVWHLTDDTLTISGASADAKTTGDNIKNINTIISKISDTVEENTDILHFLDFKYPINIFDKSYNEDGYVGGWIRKKIINKDDGSLSDTTSNIGVTYLIPVLNKTKITMKYGDRQVIAKMRHVAAYNNAKQIIDYSDLNINSYSIPTGTKYVRIEHTYGSSDSISNLVMVSDNETAGTVYEEYFKPIEKTTILTNALAMNYIQIFNKYTTIGDSLMAGFVNRGDVTCNSETAKSLNNNWPSYIAQRTGKVFTNLAVGGSTAKKWREELLNNANIDTNCYLIGIGVNDHRKALTIGTENDIVENFVDNVDSFYGNYDFMLRQLMTWKPVAHIFCFTIPSIEGGTSENYNVAIRKITSLYPEKVHCIDLASDYTNEYNTAIVQDNYTNDHFNPIVYNYFSGIIEQAINKYISDNYALFGDAPYA